MIFLLYLLLIQTKNYAILVNTSKGYINYRHTTSIQLFYNILIDNNFSENEIVSLFVEDQIQDPRNLFKEKIAIEIPIKYFKLQTTDLNLQSLVEILSLKHNKLKYINENDNLLIYLCGHGNTNFLKLYNRFFFFKNDLMKILNKISKRVNGVFLIVDTCKAESLIDRKNIPENVYIATTSAETEMSYSIEIDPILGVSTADAVPYLFYKMVPNYMDKKLDEIFYHMNLNDLKSIITYGGNKDFVLKDFLIQDTDKTKIKNVKPYKIN